MLIRILFIPFCLQGLSMIKRGCELKNSYACYYLSALYITGRNNVTKDMEKAFQYADTGCNLGCIYSCGNLSQVQIEILTYSQILNFSQPC